MIPLSHHLSWVNLACQLESNTGTGAVKEWLCVRGSMQGADGANGTWLLDFFALNTAEWVMGEKKPIM